MNIKSNTAKNRDLQASRTTIHDSVEGQVAKYMNLAFCNLKFKDRTGCSLKTEKTSRSEKDFHFADLKTSLDEDRKEIVCYVEVKTSCRAVNGEKKSLQDVINHVFQDNRDQFNRLKTATENQARLNRFKYCAYVIIIAIYRHSPKKTTRGEIRDNEFNVLLITGLNSEEFSYRFYTSLNLLYEDMKDKSFTEWIDCEQSLLWSLDNLSNEIKGELAFNFYKDNVEPQQLGLPLKQNKRGQRSRMSLDEWKIVEEFSRNKLTLKALSKKLECSYSRLKYIRQTKSHVDHKRLVELYPIRPRREFKSIDDVDLVIKPKLSFFQRIKNFLFK